MADQLEQLRRRSWLAILTGAALASLGGVMAYGGALLLALGGSIYYIVAGFGLIAAGALLALQRSAGGLLYAAIYLATLVWAYWEVGADFWMLSPRIVAPTLLFIPVALSFAMIERESARHCGSEQPGRVAGVRVGLTAAASAACALMGFGVAAMSPKNAIYGQPHAVQDVVAQRSADWTSYGGTNAGRRFVAASQIRKDNVASLKVAWTARSGDIPGITGSDENTPLQIGTRLVTCSPSNIIHAFDVDSGKRLWRFDPEATGLRQRCRGVGYFQVPPTKPSPSMCRERIMLTTIDARLIAIDLETGRPCEEFGKNGSIDLSAGLGKGADSLYFLTSAPTVARDLVIVGGLVMDGASVDMPSGVVRAFDANSGALRWAWDLGNAEQPNALPGAAGLYSRGTPNVWAPPSVDDALGLVYLPTGNPAPDHWGGNRTPEMERFSSAVIALELATGKLRWSFQTTHHDLWDYDVPSQPTLYDIPNGQGGRLPALLQPTKRGEIFVLDRRTGRPIVPVEERPVPQGRITGDRTASTQPYSVGMPTISAPRLREVDMWGLSPLDQLWCRLAFRKLRYDGDFTPPGEQPSLLFPGVFGGMNWGSASIDEANDLLIVNDIRIGDMLALVPRREADFYGKKVLDRLTSREITPGHGGFFAQEGAPYAAIYAKFMSPLALPCTAPPYGTLTAIDLKTRKIAWQIPMGTTRDTGPLGIATGLDMPVGLPTIGGSVITGSGLVFFAGSQDFYLRAMDSLTGRELWKARLPVGAGATPMSFVSPRTGRQYVVISASGSRNSPVKGDHIIAFALPLADQ